jgi:hypothetical protein
MSISGMDTAKLPEESALQTISIAEMNWGYGHWVLKPPRILEIQRV